MRWKGILGFVVGIWWIWGKIKSKVLASPHDTMAVFTILFFVWIGTHMSYSNEFCWSTNFSMDCQWCETLEGND